AASMTSRIDRATRLISAAPSKLAEAFAAPDSFMAWLPPAGMTGRALEYDYREGGRYRIELTYAAGGAGKSSANTDISTGRFLALEPGRRIVMSVEFDSADPAFAGTMVMTWSLDSVSDGTKVTVSAADVPSGIAAADHEAGLASSLENLARFVE
ncbi:SRPBCC domain-containing protein, partial [Allosphingosinicella sp.]|uniref:SRPBCC domain-containing protein n=1 Tax=Allosphingosinicella sp. TaxID=2823234 RepID=UPI002F0D58EA